eukprot:TRINITY_DN95919_c0_g1_i1.p1 TRINITY_DN95919_c0_g1~~TRINITY_DN95919_c0_g1_i1.p1  ORF type:complete len:165 (-),score=7.14 TRINITY_DN95919_c0_g1_i1:180-674(-)
MQGRRVGCADGCPLPAGMVARFCQSRISKGDGHGCDFECKDLALRMERDVVLSHDSLPSSLASAATTAGSWLGGHVQCAVGELGDSQCCPKQPSRRWDILVIGRMPSSCDELDDPDSGDCFVFGREPGDRLSPVIVARPLWQRQSPPRELTYDWHPGAPRFHSL